MLARFNQPGDRILLTDAILYGDGMENVVCHQVLFLEPESLVRLMDALERVATAPLNALSGAALNAPSGAAAI